MKQIRKIGILLLNLGGPEREEDVAAFLYNLFSDRQLIRLGPALLQKPLARFIAFRRAPRSRAIYKKIGGGSPILRITRAQALSLERMLGNQFLVRVCMRYWHPRSQEVLKTLGNKVEQLILLPLYPHYSRATSGSSIDDVRTTISKLSLNLPLHIIRSWPDHPGYIACLAKRIQEGYARFDSQDVEIVYSAHSLPQRFIDQGDPYVEEIRKTITALEKITGRSGHLCYQSRSGPVAWLEPSTDEMLASLARQGRRNVLMVPISFVSDHIETLYEINMLYRQEAKKLGIRLRSTSGLNDDPAFIDALANLVRNHISSIQDS